MSSGICIQYSSPLLKALELDFKFCYGFNMERLARVSRKVKRR